MQVCCIQNMLLPENWQLIKYDRCLMLLCLHVSTKSAHWRGGGKTLIQDGMRQGSSQLYLYPVFRPTNLTEI